MARNRMFLSTLHASNAADLSEIERYGHDAVVIPKISRLIAEAIVANPQVLKTEICGFTVITTATVQILTDFPLYTRMPMRPVIVDDELGTTKSHTRSNKEEP